MKLINVIPEMFLKSLSGMIFGNRKWIPCLFVIFTLFNICANAQIVTFSNSTSTACGTNFGTGPNSLIPKTISVSGLPVGALDTNGIVLRQINIKLGNTTCKGNLSSYVLKLKNPSGTQITFANGLTTSISSMWVDMKFRDNSALEKLKEYTTSTQSSYYPHKIGYYALETDGLFDNFNDNTNPNGDWTLDILENTSSEVSFERVDLIFGPRIQINDVTGITDNNNCSGAVCLDGIKVVRATNNGFAAGDPNYPGNIVGGCDWNGANNNSAWFEFIASGTTAYITLSGITNTPSSGSNETQAIVLQAPASCALVPSIVPAGGCANDEAINNSSYSTANGGGSSPGNIYFNGMSDNMEFNLSGLIPDQKYFLYIDGNGGVSSTFYIEMPSGGSNCPGNLPVSLKYFNAAYKNKKVALTWATASEYNNSYFLIEKSADGKHWQQLIKVNGAGTSNQEKKYLTYDLQPVSGYNYYRLKQTDFDGRVYYSATARVFVNQSGNISITQNVSDDILITGLTSGVANEISVFDYAGKIVLHATTSDNYYRASLNKLSNGVYLINIRFLSESVTEKFVKGYSNR